MCLLYVFVAVVSRRSVFGGSLSKIMMAIKKRMIYLFPAVIGSNGYEHTSLHVCTHDGVGKASICAVVCGTLAHMSRRIRFAIFFFCGVSLAALGEKHDYTRRYTSITEHVYFMPIKMIKSQ